MEIQYAWPSLFRFWSLGSENSEWDICAAGFPAVDDEIFCFADWEERTSSWDENPGFAGGGDGLEVHLLLVRDECYPTT